jgi:hypothetical protein
MTIRVDQHGLTVQASRPALVQNIAFGAASAQSAAFQMGSTTPLAPSDGTAFPNPVNNTTHIRVCSNTACWISFGNTPTAIAGGVGSILIPAYTPEYFWVFRGERIAVIQDSAAGSLNVAELAN